MDEHQIELLITAEFRATILVPAPDEPTAIADTKEAIKDEAIEMDPKAIAIILPEGYHLAELYYEEAVIGVLGASEKG